jgi:hypothetical protein
MLVAARFAGVGIALAPDDGLGVWILMNIIYRRRLSGGEKMSRIFFDPNMGSFFEIVNMTNSRRKGRLKL